MTKAEEFELANRAFECMTMRERGLVLVIFSTLRYPTVLDRFTEAVYRVVRGSSANGDAVKEQIDGSVRSGA